MCSQAWSEDSRRSLSTPHRLDATGTTLALKNPHLVEQGRSTDDALPVAVALECVHVFAAGCEPLLCCLAADPQDVPDGLPGVPRLAGAEHGLSEQALRLGRSLAGRGHKQGRRLGVLVEPGKQTRLSRVLRPLLLAPPESPGG